MSNKTIYPLFVDNKYYRLYIKLISKSDSSSTSYTELHHIIPRSLGGSNEKDNIVRLTSRKHFIAHYLLTKFTIPKTQSWYSMIKAFDMMSVNPVDNIRYINSRLYESNRKCISETMSIMQSGSNNSQFGTIWAFDTNTNKAMKISKTKNLPEGFILGRTPPKEPKIKQRKKRIYVKSIKLKFCLLCGVDISVTSYDTKYCTSCSKTKQIHKRVIFDGIRIFNSNIECANFYKISTSLVSQKIKSGEFIRLN